MRSFFAAAFFVVVSAACSRAPVTPSPTDPVVTAARFNGAVVLDVRTPAEHAAGHIRGAHNIPFDALDARAAEVATVVATKDRAVVVYCAEGARAGLARLTLERQGYTHVANGGGYDAIVAAVPALKAD